MRCIKIRHYPEIFTLTLLLISTVILIAYTSIVNLPFIYEELTIYGITKKQLNHFILIESYKFTTVGIIAIILGIIAIILGIKLAEKVSNTSIGVDRMLKVTRSNIIIFILIILPSPLYMIAQIGYLLEYNKFLNNLFITFSIMLLISYIITFYNEKNRW